MGEVLRWFRFILFCFPGLQWLYNSQERRASSMKVMT